jgi:tRNA (guanine-N7-)-methyltransferase
LPPVPYWATVLTESNDEVAVVRRRTGLRPGHGATVEPIGLEVRNLPKPIRGRVLFGNDRPLEMEIGTGKGTFLAEETQTRPDVNFIGIERATRYWRHASDRLRRRGCSNARVILVEAEYFLTEFVPDDVLTTVYVHFPDPWPKKRHRKRRLVQSRLIREIERVLVSGGRLQIVTDHLEYYAHIEAVVRSSSLLPSDYVRPTTADDEKLLVGSNFERKYRGLGRNSYTVAAVKAEPTSRLRTSSA